MGRPPLPPGTFGKILFLPSPTGQVTARVYFRDFDGRTRQVTRCRPSRAAAERALKVELTRRQAPAGGGAITAATTLADLADSRLAVARDWSSGTERTYRAVVHKQVKPALGRLRVGEVTPGVVTRALRTIAERHGPGAARTTRTCLSGMFAMAVEDDAVSANPVHASSARVASGRGAPRALTVVEPHQLLELFAQSEPARELDLPDLVAWMLATGCRIGEALALRDGSNTEGKPVLDRVAAHTAAAGNQGRLADHRGAAVRDATRFPPRCC